LAASPFAADVALNARHAWNVVQLFGHVFTNALELAAATASSNKLPCTPLTCSLFLPNRKRRSTAIS